MGIALPAFVTNKAEQGEVLSAFFYGYMCTQVASQQKPALERDMQLNVLLCTVVVDPGRVFRYPIWRERRATDGRDRLDAVCT
jgi:hypothetical protein